MRSWPIVSLRRSMGRGRIRRRQRFETGRRGSEHVSDARWGEGREDAAAELPQSAGACCPRHCGRCHLRGGGCGGGVSLLLGAPAEQLRDGAQRRGDQLLGLLRRDCAQPPDVVKEDFVRLASRGCAPLCAKVQRHVCQYVHCGQLRLGRRLLLCEEGGVSGQVPQGVRSAHSAGEFSMARVVRRRACTVRER